MKLKMFAIALFLIPLSSCSSANWKGQTNFGVQQLFISQAGICNNKILITTGKVDSSSQSDGWTMIDAKTNELVRVSGDTIIIDATSTQISTYINASSKIAAQQLLNELVQKDGTILKQPEQCKQSEAK